MAKHAMVHPETWFTRKRRSRGRRALERQLEYQKAKALSLRSGQDNLVRSNFLRCQVLRQRLERIKPIPEVARVLEVGSGAHGLVFGFGASFGVGIDPLAVDYKRLFPALQSRAITVTAIGEELPFPDASFDVVLSDNVIDHAEQPLKILDELVRVLRPGALLYFTVNIHHPIYELASKAHGAWNALGLKLELSAFADHTVHLSEKRISDAFTHLPLEIVERSSNIAETKAAYRRSKRFDADTLMKKVFFKNALFELIAIRSNKVEKTDGAL
jgi:SAM-dependent methyltransferase